MVEDCPVFYNIRDGPYYPALRILHQVRKPTCEAAVSISSASSRCHESAAVFSPDKLFAAQYPEMMPTMRVDAGAIKYVFSGPHTPPGPRAILLLFRRIHI
jgi:hypothetical protein